MVKINTILDELLHIRKRKQQNRFYKSYLLDYYNRYLQLKDEIENPSLSNQPLKKSKLVQNFEKIPKKSQNWKLMKELVQLKQILEKQHLTLKKKPMAHLMKLVAYM